MLRSKRPTIRKYKHGYDCHSSPGTYRACSRATSEDIGEQYEAPLYQSILGWGRIQAARSRCLRPTSRLLGVFSWQGTVRGE